MAKPAQDWTKITERRCGMCGQTKAVTEFGKNKAAPSGLNAYCKPCYSAYTKAWREKNREHKSAYNAKWYERNSGRISRAMREHRENHWVWVKLKHTRDYCKAKDIAYDLDDHLSELSARYATGKCEMTGIPFALVKGRRDWNTPSIDRIDPAGGYVYGNVRFVLWIMNAAMSTWGEDRLHSVMTRWLAQRL